MAGEVFFESRRATGLRHAPNYFFRRRPSAPAEAKQSRLRCDMR